MATPHAKTTVRKCGSFLGENTLKQEQLPKTRMTEGLGRGQPTSQEAAWDHSSSGDVGLGWKRKPDEVESLETEMQAL